jgi:hypothetical protein
MPALLPCFANCANSKATIYTGWRRPMADHSEIAYTAADGNDYPAHEQTYECFLALVKYGTIGVVAIVLGMYIFLV